MNKPTFVFSLFLLLTIWHGLLAQTAMINVDARTSISLNGKWAVMIDPANTGEWRQVWKEPVPQKKSDFFEYSFDRSPLLNVPSDFNSQMPELTYYQGTVWYKRSINFVPKHGKRMFIYFGAVNYIAKVYLNGEFIGSHEGGFTPFQFEVTAKLVAGSNAVVVQVNNERKNDGLPGLGFDWLNYGGITRDVVLIETPETYIEDYFIQLKRGSINEAKGWVQINGNSRRQNIKITIPELKVNYLAKTDEKGLAVINFRFKPDLWSPANPKLYKVVVSSETDYLTDRIGFRSIEAKGTDILLNGTKVFWKGINIHEEEPLRGARAFSRSDALILLTWAKELGCNLVRLSHYPHSEHMVRLAEEMGIMVWSELPVYQHIEFSTSGVQEKWEWMMKEMVRRDRNRAAVVTWCVSNETYHFTPMRNEGHIKIVEETRKLDDTRLISVVVNSQGYSNHTIDVWDPVYNDFDFIALNEYIGWYIPWQGKPSEIKWKLLRDDKPVVISEFGGEALFGNNDGPADEAVWWSEEYLEQIYKDQVEMFSKVPNLSGVIPWLLVDYRSPGRMHPVYQSGWNRKGVLSDRGDKKKAWYVLKKYFDGISNGY